MEARFGGLLVLIGAMGISLLPSGAVAGTSEASRKALTQLLLGKEVKPLLQLPATLGGEFLAGQGFQGPEIRVGFLAHPLNKAAWRSAKAGSPSPKRRGTSFGGRGR